MSGSAMVFYFVVYAAAGWGIEQLYSRFTTGAFKKDGFLWGPLKPMYGIAPLWIMWSIAPDMSWIQVAGLCMLLPTIVELISGIMLSRWFNMRYWDYSSYPFQIKGYICVRFSIYWMLLCLVMWYGVQPVLASVYAFLMPVWLYIQPIVLIYLVTDIGWTILHKRMRKGNLAPEPLQE